MKLNLGKRIVLFFHWLCSLILAVLLFGNEYVGKLYAKIEPIVDAQYLKIALIAFILIYAILSIAVLVMTFKRSTARSERGFITMDSSETGKVRIAVGAIEQMVKQAVGSVEGIADMRISIASLDDAIAINVNVSVVNGSHVPTVTMNMQRAIRQFVELNCGVAVRSVSINVQTVVNPADVPKRGRKAELKSAPVLQPVHEVQPEAVQEDIPVVYAQEEAPVVEQQEYVAEETVAEEPVVEEIAAEEPVEEFFVPIEEAEVEENVSDFVEVFEEVESVTSEEVETIEDEAVFADATATENEPVFEEEKI